MKTKLLLAALLTLGASGSILAQQTENASSPSSKTRAQALEELRKAQASGIDMPSGFIAYHTPVTKEPTQLPTKTASKN